MTYKNLYNSKPWTDEEKARLRQIYPSFPRSAIEAALPGRTWRSITERASILRVKRQKVLIAARMTPADNLMESLRDLRMTRKLSAVEVSDAIGYARTCVSKWERGASHPDYFALTCWCDFFGVELAVQAKPVQMARAA